MRKSRIKFTNNQELGKLHNATIDLLREVGMKIQEPRIVQALEKQGCKTDVADNRVYFKPELIEETINGIRSDIDSGKLKQIILNGPMCSKTDGTLKAKFGGACKELYDFETGEIREAAYQDVVDATQLGEALPEVDLVGNTVSFMVDDAGKRVDPRLERIKTCALVAKNTSKPASTEIANIAELDLQIEMGIVVRGSKEEFLNNPCFITAKETISPLRLENEAAVMLLALAERHLPCTIIPMPLAGVSVAVTRESAVVIGNAEILGTMTALRVLYPDARVGGGMMSGTVNMRTGSVVLASPEGVTADLILAELYEELYGQDLGIGVGGIDAKYPGTQAAAEKITRMTLAYLTGRTNYMVGMLASITRFSAEQAIIELELAKYIHAIFREIKVTEDTVPLELFRELGPGGNFINEEHTALNFRKNLWLTDIFDQTAPTHNMSEDKKKDILINAHERVNEVLSKSEKYHLPDDREKEIDKIVRKAEKLLAQ